MSAIQVLRPVVVGRACALTAAFCALALSACGDNQPARVVVPPVPEPVLDSGHTTLRRLNRTEYNNTVRDLLGTAAAPANQFPPDESADGFDTVGEYLAFTMERAQSSEDAAAALIDEVAALPADDPRHASLFTCDIVPGDELTCARAILTPFARRAWRRAPTSDEVDDLASVVTEALDAGGTADEGLRNALTLVLVSPHFLFHVEENATPDAPDAVPVDDDALASRLSYFLWSSMPDDELFAAADAHDLTRQLPAQIARMLADPRAAALADDFAGQWLSVRVATNYVADPVTFPGFTLDLPASAARETTAFFADMVAEDLPIETLLLSDFTFTNARLDADYDLAQPGVGDDLARTSLTGTPRIGILTQASFLMSTSLPQRTSPVKRGAWVLDRLLCTPPPPVPANLEIPPLEVPPPGATLRQAQEEHRSNPVCAPCHNLMDPIGLGLENFDAIGRFRTMDNGAAVDASGTLPSGQTFSGARELAPLLAKDPQFAACVMQKLLTYAVGRPFSSGNAQGYAGAMAAFAASGAGQAATWRRWITSVANSAAFRTRRGVAP